MDIVESDLRYQIKEFDSVDEKVIAFNNTLISILDKHAPLQTNVIIIRPNTQWFSKEITFAKQKTRQAARR